VDFPARKHCARAQITEEPTGIDYLKMVAVSRLFLDNVQHIQSSWLTQGLRLGQTALRFGADDMGSIMIEKTSSRRRARNTEANEKELRYQIREAGFHSAAARYSLQLYRPRKC
jgi:cyclic dehypoxanthinyl futalosine synthase